MSKFGSFEPGQGKVKEKVDKIGGEETQNLNYLRPNRRKEILLVQVSQITTLRFSMTSRSDMGFVLEVRVNLQIMMPFAN